MSVSTQPKVLQRKDVWMTRDIDSPQDSTPIVNITGDLVTLGPMRKDLIPTITRWMNDFSGTRTLGPRGPRPVMEETESDWIDSLARSRAHLFVIRERATERAIGTTDLTDIDDRNRCATFGINIGEASARGRGFGTEATKLMLDYAFTVLGLHSVGLGVAEFNLAGIHAYRNAGFRECGRWRQRWWYAGKLWDHVLMDCLTTEFESPVLARTFTVDASERQYETLK
jgi:RimJ/RimL family protein N-acetyltransferase